MAERYEPAPRAIHRTLDRAVAPIPRFARGRLQVWTARYEVRAPLERVFATYLATHPARSWPERWVRFWVARQPDGAHVYGSDPWPGMEVGARLCCGLRVLTPTDALDVWTGVEVTAIEPGRRLRYDYLEGSTTAGMNEVTFEADGGRTVILHRSEYCGATRLEHALLPLLEARYHGGFVNGMHAALRRRCEHGPRDLVRAERADPGRGRGRPS